MARKTSDNDELTEKEIERRRDEALKRALNTPHKPHKKVRPPDLPDDGRNQDSG